ncbi:DALR anticodon-binding domain-containing protein 3 [Uranotaenia lowii]|uniref:DALR anticodon-binding domain-containing protein 3 n=1 Tax=Uranotaenia lowii TaxID=190385 RepID=UPI00247A03D0|nr:DALR anticodon-binding domain-containing protein 3 [Uranotaenia lowii]
MDLLVKLENKLSALFHEKFQPDKITFKYNFKQLDKLGDFVVKIVNPKCEDFARVDATSLIAEFDDSNGLSITNAEITDAGVHVFVERNSAYTTFLRTMSESYLGLDSNLEKTIKLESDVQNSTLDLLSLTDLRILSVKTVVNNLLKLNGFKIQSSEATTSDLHIKISRSSSSNGNNQINLLCGPVVCDRTKAVEYVDKRANDMQLIAQHKYGIRVKDNERFKRTISSLGRSAAIVDLLESKISSPIDMRKADKNQSSKGASFILYNYARLSVLFRTFEEKQSKGYYPVLPDIGDVDFGLLKEEDEWQLFWVYVCGYPSMLRHALGDDNLEKMAPHLVLAFASGLVISLSKYYRRIRILTENRSHLLPVMFARIQLLKVVYRILSTLLDILDLEPVTQM